MRADDAADPTVPGGSMLVTRPSSATKAGDPVLIQSPRAAPFYSILKLLFSAVRRIFNWRHRRHRRTQSEPPPVTRRSPPTQMDHSASNEGDAQTKATTTAAGADTHGVGSSSSCRACRD
jgi:hypothetical protein